jgi:hypothetical protein
MRALSSRRALHAPELALMLLACAAGCQGSVAAPGGGSGANAAESGGTESTGTGGDGPANSGRSGSSGKSSGGSGGSGAVGEGAAAGEGSVEALNALESVARRLTRTEIDAAVRDVLGDDSAPAAKVLAEDEFNPFDNDYTLQRASRALIDSLEAFAEDVAARAVSEANRDRVVSCTPSGADDTACFTETIETLGRRLFRRPLSEDEVAAYLTLQAFATEDNPAVDNDFYTGVDLAIRSMLQDPEFLYRIEIGTPGGDPDVLRLDGYELATRLSFLLWGSTPSDELLDAAADGVLADGAGRREQAEELLEDQRARNALHRFHAMWLGYRAIPHDAELTAAFDLETSQLIDRVIFDEPSSYLDLFLSPETYLNARLAEQYDLPSPAGGEGWVSYGDSGRAGILSHGSVLAAFSKFSDTSPTQRGIFVQTRLLCNRVEPPPANVNVDQPPTSDDAVCKIDRYAEHRETPSCAGCHAELDPIGFGLEAYDVGGRLRTADDGHPECEISGDGELPGYGTFNGPRELAERLVASGEVTGCFVQHLLSYAIGRPVRENERGVVAELTRTFESEDHAARELLLDFVASDRFALRREEPVP